MRCSECWNEFGEHEDGCLASGASAELRSKYLGVLGLLEECSPFVDEETRALIVEAFEDAKQLVPGLQIRCMADRVCIAVAED